MMDSSEGLKKDQTLCNGKYRIEKILGSGSFGITYLATAKFITQGNLGQMEVEGKVAIKEFFMSEVNARKEDGSLVEGSIGSVFTYYRKKFRNEAENLSKLCHPNIVEVCDVFDENNTTYYVMKFLEGQNLDDYIKQQGRIEEQEAISITNDIGGALVYMHSMKILHLDIKPKNIMRTNDGKYYLIDFGLSKQFTDAGEPESSTSIGFGTPGYAPIEQTEYMKDGLFPATLDVYALAATLFKMLSGVRPPEATYILNEGFPIEQLTAVGISDHICFTLEKGMSPVRKQRYQTIEAFLKGFAYTEIEEITIITPIPIQKPESESESVPNPKPKSWKWLFTDSPFWRWISVIIAIAALSIIIYYNMNKPELASALTDPETVEVVREKLSETVTDMSWDSPLGKAIYSGAVQPDSVVNNKFIPHGKGHAKITSGEYAGCVYAGEFNWGKYEGITKYTQSNGDVFEGTFKNNQYYQGRYTIKSTGEYFEGTFKDGQPDTKNGKWHDRAN